MKLSFIPRNAILTKAQSIIAGLCFFSIISHLQNAHASTAFPNMGLRIVHSGQFVAETVVYQIDGFKPVAACELEPVGALPEYNMGPYDIYFGMLTPQGTWRSWTVNPQTGAGTHRLVDGLVPLVQNVTLAGGQRTNTGALSGGQGAQVFPSGSTPGQYWLFCLAIQPGQPVDDMGKWRNMVISPVLLK